MATALDLIQASMRMIGVLASGESLSANEATDALSSLNRMLATWSNENLLIYSKTLETFTLVSNQQSYTMGSGGNFNTTRPQLIENASLRTTSSSTALDLPIEIIDKDQWASISVKSIASSIPTKLFVQSTYPLATLWLWPIPSDANTLVLWSWKTLSSIATTAATVDLPPGYEDAIIWNLAVRLGPEYGRPADPMVVAEAAESKAAIKRMNHKPQLLTIDSALLSHRPTFRWLTGE